MTPFTVVVVLHDSEPELATLLASLTPSSPSRRSWSSSTPARATAARSSRAAHGAELIELPDNPGFGAANNAGVARARHDVTVLLNPDTELVDDSLHELAALRANPSRMRCTLRACSSPTARVQRSAHPLPGTVGALLPGARAPAAAPASAARPRRALPRRDARAPSAGRSPRAWPPPRPRCARLGPFDPAVHLFAEDMELGLRARAARHPDRAAPAAARSATPAGTPCCAAGSRSTLLARRRREAIGSTLGARALALDDAAQALTFATRIAATPALGATPPGSAHSSRPSCMPGAMSGASRSGASCAGR